MTKIIVFITIFFTGLLSAQISESRKVGSFSKLKVSQSIEVLYTISDKISVKVETDDAAKMQTIKTEVEGETLQLFVDTKNYAPQGKKRKNKYNDIRFTVLKITISGPDLSEIKASSAGVVNILNLNNSEYLNIGVSSSGAVKGNFVCNNTTIVASSSGTFRGEMTAKNTSIEASSSGTIVLKGSATHLDCKASSSGDCHLKDFKVENATVSGSSSATVAVYVSKALTAKASSSADITYYGNPINVIQEASSSGSVSRK